MKIAAAAGKAAASAALVSAAAAFLVFFGPKATTTVSADIYAPLAAAAGLLPAPGASTPLRAGIVLVNGQKFQYAVGHTKWRLQDVLKHYEDQFETEGPTRRTMQTSARVDADGAGVVAGIKFGDLRVPDDVAERFAQFAATKRFASFGRFHVISAFQQQGTVFLDFTPADDTRVDGLLPSGRADAPGEDLRGVTRPAGLQRLLTIEHGEGSAWSRTLIYRTLDNRRAVDDFRGALAAAGWTVNPQANSATLAHYTDGARECFVGGGGSEANGVVIVVQRMNTVLQSQS